MRNMYSEQIKYDKYEAIEKYSDICCAQKLNTEKYKSKSDLFKISQVGF